MACTILRLVEIATNLRKRFECVLQASIDSLDGEEIRNKNNKKEHILDSDPSNSRECSKRIIEDKCAFNTHHKNMCKTKHFVKEENINKSLATENKKLVNKKEFKERMVCYEKSDSRIKKCEKFTGKNYRKMQNSEICKYETVYSESLNVCDNGDNDPADSTTSETDSDTFCSIKTVRLTINRRPVSPSSECKPAKLSRCANVDEHDQPLTIEEHNKSSSSGSDSGGNKTANRKEWLGYSKWLLMGRLSLEGEKDEEILGTNNKEEDGKIQKQLMRDDTLDLESLENIFEFESESSIENSTEANDTYSPTSSEELNFVESSEEELESENEIVILQESLDDEGYVDDYKSFESNSIDIIYEQDEEDDKHNLMLDNLKDSLTLIGNPNLSLR